MPRGCKVLGCFPWRNIDKKKRQKCLFKFPKEKNILTKWIEATGRIDWVPKKGNVICEIHFKAECFDDTKRRKRLKPDSVPTEHLPFLFISNIDIEDVKIESDINIENVQKENHEIQNISETKRFGISQNSTQNISELLKELQMKIQKLEKGYDEVKCVMQSYEEEHEKELQYQANVLKYFYKKEQDKYKDRLDTKDKQLKILRKRLQRRDNRIENLLTNLKKSVKL